MRTKMLVWILLLCLFPLFSAGAQAGNAPELLSAEDLAGRWSITQVAFDYVDTGVGGMDGSFSVNEEGQQKDEWILEFQSDGSFRSDFSFVQDQYYAGESLNLTQYSEWKVTESDAPMKGALRSGRLEFSPPVEGFEYTLSLSDAQVLTLTITETYYKESETTPEGYITVSGEVPMTYTITLVKTPEQNPQSQETKAGGSPQRASAHLTIPTISIPEIGIPEIPTFEIPEIVIPEIPTFSIPEIPSIALSSNASSSAQSSSSGASANQAEGTGNISQLEIDGVITVTVTGNSINSTHVSIRNEAGAPVTVAIEPGTWFQSSSSSVQNMLVTSSQTINLAAGETRAVNVSTACMNMSLDIPDATNSFSVVYDPSSMLAKLASYVDENNCEYEVVQAAVWIITDSAKDNVLRSILVDQDGNSVIEQKHIDEAREILAGLE